MKQELFTKSSEWAQKAMRSYIENQHEHFFVQSGVSFELLGKAYLAGIHPSLIVDRDFDSLLQVCGYGIHSRRAPGNIRTIGAKDVISRVSQLIPQLKSYEQQLGFLAEVRNGAVHLGSILNVDVPELTSIFLRATKILIEKCGQDIKVFFGSYADIVNKLLDDSAKEVEKTVTIKLARAKQVFDEKFGELEVKTVEEIAETVRQTYTLYEYNDEYDTCPACSNIGLASGTYEVEWEQADWDDPTPEPIVRLNVESFYCKMCGLSLDGRDEVVAAKLRDKIIIEDVDPKFLFELGYED
jgi:hypothetical protein